MIASLGNRFACMLFIGALALGSEQLFANEPAEPDFGQMAFCSDYAYDEIEEEEYCEPAACNTDVDYELGCCDCGDSCGDSCGSCCQQCCTPLWMHRSGVWGQFLYLHPMDADMAHAQQQNGTGGAGTTPFGVIGVADPDHTPGFRVGAQCAMDACSSVALSYTYLDSSAVNSVTPPTSVGGGLGTVGSLVHHPAGVDPGTGPVITGSAGPVDATYDIEMQLIDAEFRSIAHASNCSWVNWSLGARYGRLVQDFQQLGNFGGSSGGVIDTTTQVDFDGYGLKAGIDGERVIGCRGFSVYGNAALSALFGSFRGDYLMNNATTVSDLAIARWEDDRAAPMLEYELGLAWTSCSGCCKAKIGYTAIHWYDVVTTPEFVDAVQADNYTDVGSTLSFQGLTSSIEWRY